MLDNRARIPIISRQTTAFAVRCALFCAGAAWAIAAQAQAQLPDARSAAYMWAPGILQRLQALSNYMDQAILGKAEVCGGEASLQPISVAVLEPLSFTEESVHPARGAWRIRYRFDRCGEAIVYNALFRANAQAPPTVYHLPPGTTRASAGLMEELSAPLLAAAARHDGDVRDCRLVAVTNTAVTAEPGTIQAGGEVLDGVWEENWTVRTCSGPFTLDFCFIPEKSGGTTWTQSRCDPAQIAAARSLVPKK
jgi:hypothetical protein